MEGAYAGDPLHERYEVAIDDEFIDDFDHDYHHRYLEPINSW